jgi:Na+/proline symporter
VTLLAFVGGLSAATAMVVVESVALVHHGVQQPCAAAAGARREPTFGAKGRHVLLIRRSAIAGILFLAYSYYRMIGDSLVLAQSGLMSFAAIVQFAPAFFGGLIVAQGRPRRRHGGLLAGFGGVGLHAADAVLHRCRLAAWPARARACSASPPCARACCSTSTSIR